MTRLLHISDTHFGTERPQVVEALVALAAAQQPDLVLLSGDITQRARPSQFRAARRFTDRLNAPLLAIPGNHDITLFDLWARMTKPYARQRQAFGGDLEPVHASADLLLVCVNTTRPWRHKNGEVSAAQIERVAGLLRSAAAEQLRVVAVHQPIAVTRDADRHDLLRGHRAAREAWAAAGADLVLGGHIHLPFVEPLRTAPRPAWAVQAGTAVSARVREDVPNSVNLLHWRGAGVPPGACRIEQWDFDAAARAFGRAAATDVRPARP